MSKETKWLEVTEVEFNAYIAAYPRPLMKDISMMCEPPMLTYGDRAIGVWPEFVVAKAQLYDGSAYHRGRYPVHYLREIQPPEE